MPYQEKDFYREEFGAQTDIPVLSQPQMTQDMNMGSLCSQFAGIIKGQVKESNGDECVVSLSRNFNETVMGRPSKTVLDSEFSFESMDRVGRTLNIGEVVLLQNEVNPFITSLNDQGITITALHNHLLFEDPRLLYLHFLSIEDPLVFARKVRNALNTLKS